MTKKNTKVTWVNYFCSLGRSQAEEDEEDITSMVKLLQKENVQFKEELTAIKQKLPSFELDNHNTLDLVQRNKPSETPNIMFAQFINEITVVQNRSDELTRADLAKFAHEFAKGLDIFADGLRTELKYELREKLARTEELNQKQKLAVFEMLFGYTLDTNLQQCYDSARLTAFIKDLGSPEREKMATELREQATKDAETRLNAADEFLSPCVLFTSDDTALNIESTPLLLGDSLNC